MNIPLPPLPDSDGSAEANKTPHPGGGYVHNEVPAWSEALVRAIQREAMRVALVAAAELCKKEAQEAHARYRSEGSTYDDGGCDMANVLETYIEALEIANG